MPAWWRRLSRLLVGAFALAPNTAAPGAATKVSWSGPVRVAINRQ